MKLQNLKYFEKLIELKNYSSVADYFHVGQPTVSIGVRRLEQDVGYNLIVRNSNHNEFILTPAGEKFHKHSKEVINKLELLEDEVRRNLARKKINFGMPPMVNHTYFSKIAKKLNENTLSNINIIEDNTSELLKMLKVGKLDVVIGASVKPFKLKGFCSKVLTKDEFRIAVSKHNPLAKQKQITFSQVDNCKVIQMNSGYLQSDFFEKIKKERFSSPKVVYRTSDYNTIKRLIKDDVGVSFLLKKSINPEDGIAMINHEESKMIPKIYISLIFRDGNNLSNLEKNLIDKIIESFE